MTTNDYHKREYDADGNLRSRKARRERRPHDIEIGGFLTWVTLVVVGGTLFWYGLLQVRPQAPEASPAEYEARFDAIETWRDEALAIIDETVKTWDTAVDRYGAGCPQGVETPPCPFIRGYQGIARDDFQAAQDALSAVALTTQKRLALQALDDGRRDAHIVIRRDLAALERLHPVCLRWYTAEATRREAVRWVFQCPDESDPAPPDPPAATPDVFDLLPLAPLLF